jgi:hypothetical protein
MTMYTGRGRGPLTPTIATMPTRDEIDPHDVLIYLPRTSGGMDDQGRAQFTAFWRWDDMTPAGIRGQVFHADPDEYLARKAGDGKRARFWAPADDTVAVWCAERAHPYVTFNIDLNRSYCRCGARQLRGEQDMSWQAKWEMFHDHAPDAPCACYLPRHPA